MARQARDDGAVSITDAPMAHSDDLEMRQKRYALTMLVRTSCFVMIFFVPGWWRVLCVAAAALLPAIAVVLANARDNRTPPSQLAHHEEPVERPMLTSHAVIPGEVADEHDHAS